MDRSIQVVLGKTVRFTREVFGFTNQGGFFMEAKEAHQQKVQIKRNFNAPREKVYKAWTQAEELSRWFAPTDDYETIVEKLDVQEGGKYRIVMKHPNATHLLTGEYLHVQPQEKLVYTWLWEDQNPPSDMSRVTVEFVDRGASTEVILTHEKLSTEDSRQKHTHGWTGCLERLEGAL